MRQLQLVLVISLANAKELLTVYSLIAKGDKTVTKNLANLYDVVLIASSIGLNDGQLLMTVFCTLAWPYKIPGRHPTGEMFLYSWFPNKRGVLISGRGEGWGLVGNFDKIKRKGLSNFIHPILVYLIQRDPILTNDLPDFTIK